MNNGPDWIRVRGARVHNLQSVNVDLPRDRLIVITGPSGSGKSSLAFDTLYAEGQRRYLETLRVDSRALLDHLARPDVDLVEGLPPPLCVSQVASPAGHRSTLATLTDIDNYLRLLWARLGKPHCYQCGQVLHRFSVREIVQKAAELAEGTRVLVLALLVKDSKGDNAAAFQQIRRAGFLRVRVNGAVTELHDNLRLNPRQKHTIEMVVDRLVIRPGTTDRIREALETALQFGQGKVTVAEITEDGFRDHVFSTRYACPKCDILYGELAPRNFSFNNPHGACPACGGFGEVDLQNAEPQATACPECGGARLNREARSVRFAGKTLPEVNAWTVAGVLSFFSALNLSGASTPEARVQAALLPEIVKRVQFLKQVGLDYVTLDRWASTLSGGEAQRARLASHLGAGLLGVCYILDEPTVGLHPRDTGRLLASLRELQRRGSTVILVEHDETVIREADFLLEIGPGAGAAGGTVVAIGPKEEVLPRILPVRKGVRTLLCAAPEGRFTQKSPDPFSRAASLKLFGVRHHNLQNIEVEIPLGRLVCVTGVSGSGKSSLVYEVLCPAVRRHLGLSGPEPGLHDRIEGLGHINKLIEVDQSPLGRSARSTPATYTGLFDEIRKLFATTREAKTRGYKANRFSFNVRGGRCEECQGQGVQKVALQLLPDLTVPCPRCRGQRFDTSTLEIRFKGRSIADVLDMPMEQALAFFADVPALAQTLQVLVEVGLGYLKLGQPSAALSGGEAQRVKLAAELSRRTTGQTLLLLDEPTTGLHFSDIERLLGLLRKLVEAGNSLIVIEHNLDLITAADWVIDLGPEGGPGGGQVVAAGPPAQIAGQPQSLTGQAIRQWLSG